jgi:hypothetical protein
MNIPRSGQVTRYSAPGRNGLGAGGTRVPGVGPSIWRLTGTIPAGSVAAFEQELRGLTHGEGVLISEFDSYRPS